MPRSCRNTSGARVDLKPEILGRFSPQNPAQALRVCIDALTLIGEGGISNYSRPLIERTIAAKSADWRFDLMFRLGFRNVRRAALQNWMDSQPLPGAAIYTTGIPDRLAALLCAFGDRGFRSGARPPADVLLATTAMVPRSKTSRVGWFVYDLTPLRIPQFFKGSAAKFKAAMLRRAARADFIVALSECTRKDAVELLGYPADRITVVYPGRDPIPQTRRSDGGGPAACGRHFILYLGALALNKNVDGLLRIFARCVHDHRLDIDLVLTGKDFCGTAYWAGLVQRLGIERRVRFLGWVSEMERESLLSRATMLWQFSWYEGFGLPVLEAAGRGTPVLCTDRGAVPEILRSPDQEIDPADEAAAAARAAEALKSPATLQAWREHGLKRAAEFTWARSARRLAGAIEAQIA
jgi:glycosyltransferase involved in cell wall biosynthesis